MQFRDQRLEYAGRNLALPGLRRRVSRGIGLPKSRASSLSIEDLNRRRVTACAVRLLDLGFVRIGSEQYAEQNESFGLTTILREHVTLSDGALIFEFPAKSGQRRVQAVVDGVARPRGWLIPPGGHAWNWARSSAMTAITCAQNAGMSSGLRLDTSGPST